MDLMATSPPPPRKKSGSPQSFSYIYVYSKCNKKASHNPEESYICPPPYTTYTIYDYEVKLNLKACMVHTKYTFLACSIFKFLCRWVCMEFCNSRFGNFSKNSPGFNFIILVSAIQFVMPVCMCMLLFFVDLKLTNIKPWQKIYIILLYPNGCRPCITMTPWVTPHFN